MGEYRGGTAGCRWAGETAGGEEGVGSYLDSGWWGGVWGLNVFGEMEFWSFRHFFFLFAFLFAKVGLES